MWRLPSIIMTLALAACRPAGDTGRPLLVSAAASLTGVLETLAAAYERDTGTAVELNPAASSALAAQIIAGAPVDLFISADLFQMDRVATEGLIRTETRVDLLSNQLVVVAPAGARVTVTAPAALLQPAFGRIAIGDPAAVPAGVYARTYLESVGVWEAIRDRIVPTRSVRAALATVEAGAVDAGIVYRTDALSSSGVRLVFEIPIAEDPAITYPAALTTQATNPEAAERLLAYLQGPDARAVFEQAGFIVPEVHP